MSTARPLTEGASGADASKPTTAMVPSEVPSSGIATWSQPSSGCWAAPSTEALGSQSSTVLSRTASRFSRVASNSVVSRSGSVKSRSGSSAWSTSRTTPSCSRAVTRALSYSTVWVVSGAAGSETSTVTSSVTARPPRPSAPRCESATTVSPDSRISVLSAPVAPGRSSEASRSTSVTAQVVGDQVAVLDPEQRVAVGLDDVRLVDAGLLHVGAGLAVRGADRGRRGWPSVRARRRRRPSSPRSRRRCWGCRPTRRGRPGPGRARRTTPAGRRRTPGGSGRSRSTPRARHPSPRPPARPVPAWSEPPYDVPATKAAPRPTTAVSETRVRVTMRRRGMAGPSGVDLEVAGASALISGVR